MNQLVKTIAGCSLLVSLASNLAHAQQVLLAVDTQANRILQLSPQTGAVLNGNFIADANNAATYDFQTLRAAVQVGSQIWVSDQSPSINAIYRFDLSGAYVGKIGGNVLNGGLSNVRGMRVIGDTVYVVNQGTANAAPGPALVRFDFNGNNLGSFATSAVGGTVGLSPWDVVAYNGRLLVSDGTSRGLQQYNLDGSYFGAFTTAQINNIPQQMYVRANGNVLMSAQGSTPSGSFGLYELGTNGAVLRQWTNTPGLGVRGVYELGNGQFLISEAGGLSTTRGLGTIDPSGPASTSNFTLIQGTFNGGWLSVAVIPEPSAGWLMAGGLAFAAAASAPRALSRADPHGSSVLRRLLTSAQGQQQWPQPQAGHPDADPAG